MEKCHAVAALYVSTIRAIYLVHQSSHWLSKGPTFYGDHLLFERLYKGAADDVDAAAEKMIGVFGEDCLNYTMINDLTNKVLIRYSNEDNLFNRSLKIEVDFLKFSKEVYECFDKEGKLTLGLDDFLMATASKHEESIYLLKQRAT